MLLQETPIPLDRRGREAALVNSNLEDLQPGSGDGWVASPRLYCGYQQSLDVCVS